MAEETHNAQEHSIMTNAPIETSAVKNEKYCSAPSKEHGSYHHSDLNMGHENSNGNVADHSQEKCNDITGTKEEGLIDVGTVHQMYNDNVQTEKREDNLEERREETEEMEETLAGKEYMNSILSKELTERKEEIGEKENNNEWGETFVTPCFENSNIPHTADGNEEIHKHSSMERADDDTGKSTCELLESSQRSVPPRSAVMPNMNYIENKNTMPPDLDEDARGKESNGLVDEIVSGEADAKNTNKERNEVTEVKEYIPRLLSRGKEVDGSQDVYGEITEKDTHRNDVKIYIHELKDSNEMQNADCTENEFGFEGYPDETRLSPPFGIKKRESISLSNLDDSIGLIEKKTIYSDFTKNEYIGSIDSLSEYKNESIQNDMNNICSEILSNKHADTFNSLYISSNNNYMEEKEMKPPSYEEPPMEYADPKKENPQGTVLSPRVESPTYSFNQLNNNNVNELNSSTSNHLNNTLSETNNTNSVPRDMQTVTSFEEIKEKKDFVVENSFSNKWDEFKKKLQTFKSDTMRIGKDQINNSNNYIPTSSMEDPLQHVHLAQNTSTFVSPLPRGQNSFNDISSSSINWDSSSVPNASKLGRNDLNYSRMELSHANMRKSEPLHATPISPIEITEGAIPTMPKEVETEAKRNLKGISKIETESEIESGVEPEKHTTLKMKPLQNVNKPAAKGSTIPSQYTSMKTAKTTKINELVKVQDSSRTLKGADNTGRTPRAARSTVDVASCYQRSTGNTYISREKTEKSEKGMNRVGKFERHSIANPTGSGNISHSTGSGGLCASSGPDKDITYNMNVVIRCRPMNSSEKSEGAKNIIKVLDNKVVVLLDTANNSDNVLRQNRSREKRYAFDYAFDETCTTQDVYDNSVKCLIDGVIKGYNSTVFAYGATGAGKTHTIIGYKDEPGIMTMILRDLFDKMKNLKVMNDYKVMCSFIEIYNENIVDLLNPSGEYLDLREDPIKGVTVSNLFEVCTTSVEEIMELIHTGNRNRTQEPTDANKTSSRSHGILQIVVEETEKGQGVCQQTKRGKLCVIDLAGSERASQTNNKGIRMLEGANINRSLLALGNVINALVLRSKGTSKSNFIPFRDSKLTRLLKDSLGGNCRTVMIANISPSHLSYEDTHNTLKYANRAKNIKNVVTSNAITVKQHLSTYVEIIEKLKSEIEYLKEQLIQRDQIQKSLSSEGLMHANSNSSNFTTCERLLSFEEKNYTKEELLHMMIQMKKENEKLKMTFQNLNNGKPSEDQFYECNVSTNDNIGSTDSINTSMNNMYHEELSKYKEELENVKIINEKLFSDNKNFQNKLQECSHIIKQFQMMNDDYKKQIMDYKKQIDDFKIIVHNHDINDIQMKRQLDNMKKKYEALQANRADDKEYDEMFEKWKNDITMLLNERKEIKKVIFDVEKKLIENNDMGHSKFSLEDVKILKENKNKMDHQLKENVSQTNNLMKELPTKIKDQKMKNFLYLYYTNKVLIQEKEELQVNNKNCKNCENGKIKYSRLRS